MPYAIEQVLAAFHLSHEQFVLGATLLQNSAEGLSLNDVHANHKITGDEIGDLTRRFIIEQTGNHFHTTVLGKALITAALIILGNNYALPGLM